MSTPKVLILTGDAAESLEVMYPYQRLQEEGYEVHIAAPTKKKLHFVVHDFEPGFDTYTEKPGYSWNADISFADVDPANYVALVIPGGRPGVHPQQPALRAHRAALLRSRETGSSTLPCPAGLSRNRRTQRQTNSSVSGSGTRRESCRRDVRRCRSRDRWCDGFRPGLADHPAWMREFVCILRQKAPAQHGDMAKAG